MTPTIDPDDMAGLEDLTPDDPRVRALGPKARAGLRAYRDFMAPGEVPEGAQVAEAERRLSEALERELGVTLGGQPVEAPPTAGPSVATPDRGRPRSLLDALLGPRRGPALAIAAVVIVAGAAWLYLASDRGREPVLRGTSTTVPGRELDASVQRLADGSLRLAWTPAAEAESYALVFLSPDLAELARVTEVSETHYDLRAGALPPGLVSGRNVLWRVAAMKGTDEVGRSRTIAVTVP